MGCGVFRPPTAPTCPPEPAKNPPAAEPPPGRSTVYAANGFGTAAASPNGLTVVDVALVVVEEVAVVIAADAEVG